MDRYRWVGCLALVVTLAAAVSACQSAEERKRSRGEELLKRASAKIAEAQALSFSADETGERTARDGSPRKQHVVRQVIVRRPDRLYFKSTGDRDVEAFYEGRRLTILFNDQKVFGVIPTPPTIDETVNEVSERFDIALPIGDMIVSNPHESLISSQTTGGWEGEETVDGVECARLEWHHPNVDWSIWIPTSGDPLPRKLWVDYKSRKQTMTILFTNWDLAPKVGDEVFQSKVPDDYEGVAVIQRAAAVLTPEQLAKPDPEPPPAQE